MSDRLLAPAGKKNNLKKETKTK